MKLLIMQLPPSSYYFPSTSRSSKAVEKSTDKIIPMYSPFLSLRL